MAKHAFEITALQSTDIPHTAQLAADSFIGDRHTEMKSLGPQPYDHKQTMLEILPGFLVHPRLVCLKAVDKTTSELMGFCIWGFRGFEPEEMPSVPGRQQPSEPPATKESNTETQEEVEGESHQEEQSQDDPIKRLNAMTSADMEAWVEEVMPPGVRCMYVVMLSVSPRFQGCGVGSALLNWGITCCEQYNVFAWVHSSDPAHGMYAKSGFHTIRTLDINLDDYAPCPPPNEGKDARWGHYAFRYMKYMPTRQNDHI